MASREELNNQKQYNKELEKQLTTTQEIVDYTRTLNDDSRELLGLSTKRSTAERELGSLLSSATTSLSKQLKDYNNINDVQTDIVKNAENAKRLESEAQLILGARNSKLEQHQKALQEAARLKKEAANLTGQEKEDLEYSAFLQEVAAEAALNSLTQREKLALNALEYSSELQRQNEVLASQEQGFKNINAAGGIFEGTMQSINGLLKEAGLGDLANKMGFDEIDAQMDQFKKELLAVEDEFGNITYRSASVGETLQMNIKRAGLMGGALRKAIPTMILGKMVATLTEVSKQQREQRKLTGQSATNIGAMNMSMVSSIDMLKTIAGLSKELGINVDAAFSKATLVEAAELTELMGMSSQSAAKLSLRAEATGQSLKKHTADSFKTTKNFIQQNKSAVNVGQVMDDVANVSGGVAMSLGNSTEALTNAAAQARSMGLSLKEMEGIADGLLQIESSLEAEMEAELLTGKQLNLERARSAALMNDMETVGKEIANNQEILNAFQSGNRLEQQAIAKSLGMSTDQVADMIFQQKISAGMSEEQAAKAAGISEEEAKRLSVQESLNKSMEKFAAALAPITSFLATIVSNKVILIGVFSAIAMTYIPKIVGGFNSVRNNISSLREGMKQFGSVSDAVFGKMYKGGQFMPGGGRAAAGGERAGGLLSKFKGGGDKVGDIASKSKGATPKAGAGIGGFLKGLGKGLASIGRVMGPALKGVLVIGALSLALGIGFAIVIRSLKGIEPATLLAFAGALAVLGLAAAGIGMVGAPAFLGAAVIAALGIAIIPAALSFQLLKGLDPLTMISFAGAIGILGLAAAGIGLVGPMAILGAAAIGLIGLGLGNFANAFKQVQNVDPLSMFVFAGAVTALGLAAAAIGAFGPLALVGALALGGIGLALIPIAQAFSMMQGVDPSSITAFAFGVGILGIQVASLGLLSPLIALGAAAMGGLGLAMIPLALGFQMLGESNIGMIVSNLSQLADIAPQLALLGVGLFSLAAGLTAVGISGIAAFPGIMALGTLAALATPLIKLASVFGMDAEGGGEDEKNKELQEVIDEMKNIKGILFQLLAKDTAVYIDGERLDEAIQVGSKLD